MNPIHVAESIVAQLGDLPADPLERSQRLQGMLDTVNGDLLLGIGALRSQAIREIYDAEGATETAKILGVSRGRVYDILKETATGPVEHAITIEDLASGTADTVWHRARCTCGRYLSGRYTDAEAARRAGEAHVRAKIEAA